MKKILLILAFFTGIVWNVQSHKLYIFEDGIRNFYGTVENNSQILLNWSAALAVGDKGFDVERLDANGLWQKIAFVNGGDNVLSQTAYHFTDAAPLEGKNSYRLKVTQQENSYAYSPIISVDLKRTRLGLSFQNYPNPFTSTTTIKYTVINDGPVKVAIFNISGMQLELLVNKQDEAPGTHEVQFDGSRYPAGTYIYKIFTPENNITQMMVKAK